MSETNFSLQQIDAAYINSLVELINACRAHNVPINKVIFFQSGFLVAFVGHEHADAICHDHSYGSPRYMPSFYDYPVNDWSRSGSWETIGFPWDEDDVSVHSAEELAQLLEELNRKIVDE